MNFALILVVAVFVTGMVALLDRIWLAKKRVPNSTKPLLIDYAAGLFPIFLAVLVIRSFLVEPYRIPSGSLEPTLLQGDFILVNKYSYGLRLPATDIKFLRMGEPKTGDIVVFHYPPNPSIDYIKRVIGVPGDLISYINKKLYINGKPVAQKYQSLGIDDDGAGSSWIVQRAGENLNGIRHDIYLNPKLAAVDFKNILVPKGMYFVMGDNRDDSLDSRYWGFVPERNLVGKAFLVWFSWNTNHDNVRWSRLGMRIN